MKVIDLINMLTMGQHIYILNSGENVYDGITCLIPEYVCNCTVKAIWNCPEDDCIYFSVY